MSLPREVGRIISGNGRTVAVAESITGGLVSSLITDVPGASAYFLAGFVVYSNSSKVSVLGVKESTLAEHGAVSEEVAREMARGARERSGADIGASCTGIAGPTGATPGKPIGLVHFAVDDGSRCIAHREVFSGDRQRIKRAAADRLLELIIQAASASGPRQ